MTKLAVADFFCGCGGFSHGFSLDKRYQGTIGVDSWEAAGRVYSHNVKDFSFVHADMHLEENRHAIVSAWEGKLDVMIGGPPCQGFSTLGKRRGDDSRSSLVDVYLDLALNIQPKVFLMENVRGITSMKHKSGLFFPEYIHSKIQSADVGYESAHILIDSRDYGIPQTRTRFLLIAARKDAGGLALIDKFFDNLTSLRCSNLSTLKDAIGNLPKIEAGEGADSISISVGGNETIVYNHKAMKHSESLVKRFSFVPPGGGLSDVPRALLTPHLLKLLDGGYGSGGHVKNIYGRMEWDKPSGTMIAGIDKITCGRFVHPEANRLLTPRECARIQSFPDDFVFMGSNVTQYYLIGNAVPPKLSSVIADALALALF